MSKKGSVLLVASILVLGASSPAMAADLWDAATMGIRTLMWIALACGLGLAFSAVGVGIGMAWAIYGALIGTARNPEAGGKIMTTMIIGLALMEALVIYVLLISFILAFKIPDLSGMLEAITRSL